MPTYIMETMQYKFSKFIFFCMILFILPIELVFGEEAYFDLSDQEIEIQTNFINVGSSTTFFGMQLIPQIWLAPKYSMVSLTIVGEL